MPIRDVAATVVTAPLHTEFVTALRRTSQIESVIVEVTDDEGRVGRGEAPQTWRITGQSLAGAQACLNGPLRDAVLGLDPDDVNATLDAADAAVVGNSAAKAALDVAVHDLAAQRLGVSLTRFLGGTTLSVATDVTLPAGDVDELTAAASARVAEGFTVLKVKVGLDPAGDLERLRAIRAAVGDAVTLRLDANQGWSAKQAVRIIRGMEDAGLDVDLVEQPTPARDLSGLAEVTRAVSTTILADESVHTVDDLLAVIATRAADAVNVKLAKCGGLRAGRDLLRLAASQGMGYTVGSMMEGRIGVAAAASLASAVGTSTVADLDAAWWLADSDPALTYRDGIIHLDSGPGLRSITFSPQTRHERRSGTETNA
ncbi:mandelate racemase/muconate lactonizing enzyme family protein [Stackebrandtia soli]|uniref:mandelate racemase/muconate lactonizing enzyme family protein n=1 Tax=Stackebrandtia soli TaxID=1892856 RepID=UPI0039E924D7